MQSRSCGLIVQGLSIRHCSSPRSTPYLKVWLWWIQGLCFTSIWHGRKYSNRPTRRRVGGGVWTTLSRGTLSTLHLFHEMTLHEMTLREMTPGETIPAGLTGERSAPAGSLRFTGAMVRRNRFKWFVPVFECEGKNFRS